ncbi:hypothetical protein Leryth_003113 [Lithospermum erythrorhizon]|uniref:DUF1677 family protein n=1 Tax=Lithospermum erythrorhizon TaxID=34254 RepID=A0AAV3QL76_LITER|nr:hypothetical protein Leryth_003113 [Lithospermum erythrorhizon]
MAPHGESQVLNSYARTNNIIKPPKLSNDNLKRTISDISFELSKEASIVAAAAANNLPPISEVEDAKCECCGMSEECTAEYIDRVREKNLGKYICGLCCEAVKLELEKNGGNKEEAINTHMHTCVKFNKFGRAFPVLSQAEAMRQMLKKSHSIRAKSISPRDRSVAKKGGIARSSSCIPFITREISELNI